MLQNFLHSLFGCNHPRTTFPITPKESAKSKHNTYVACLDCGREFAYDWTRMRVGQPVTSVHVSAPLIPIT